MANHNVEVKQLSIGDVLVSVDGEKQGHIGLRGNCLNSPTYLMILNNSWCIVVFEDEEWAKEQLPNIQKWYSDVWKLGDGQLVQIIGTKQT